MGSLAQPSPWDPFQDIDAMRRMMDRLRLRSPRMDNAESPDADLALDIYDQDGNLVVRAAVPGMKPEDINVTVQDGLLTIRGRMHEERDVHEGDYHLREVRTGSFARCIRLPADLDTDNMEARVEDGILRVTMPRKSGDGPKHIPVR